MESNYTDDEKPNLRPTKHITASGKTLFLHYNPNQPSNKSYIHAIQKSKDQQDPFGIEEIRIEYSLNKQKRWKILNNFSDEYTSDSLSDNDFEQTKSKDFQRIKYRLYQFHNINQKANCIGIKSNTGEQIPKKTYINKPKNFEENNDADIEDDDSVIYFATVPPSQNKQLANIRKNYGTKSKKLASSTHRHKFNQIKSPLNTSEESNSISSDEDESYSTSSNPKTLHLSDFISTRSNDTKNKKSSTTIKKSHINDDTNSFKQKPRFYRQLSKEEKLYNRDKFLYLKKQQENNELIKTKPKSIHYLMPLSYQSIYLYSPDFTIENLSKIFSKNFLHAQCSPTKYLISLTDHLKSIHWLNKPEFFSYYTSLDCYIIIIILNYQENICQGQISLNMDLYANKILIDNLDQTNDKIYTINELINKIIEFICNISFDLFKPINLEIKRKKFDNDLSESEYINKQINQIQLFNKKDLTKKLINENILINNENLIQPNICISCYSDIDQLIPMTTLKSCGHWLCNHCWKDYLENSIKNVKIILCPEWNCSSIVDIGTMLSLVNIRCMKIYENNVEKCLVNVSRSHIKCPSKSCANIIEILDPSIINIRCRCGHQFCIDCKQEPHFPTTCTSYRAYMDEAGRNGDLISIHNTKYIVQGRNCISCNEFIEKNGGCNHMTCRCGAEFCWLCTAYWKDHSLPGMPFQCPVQQVSIQKKLITKTRNLSRKYYQYAIYHRHERTFQNQLKQNENVKRLIGTIPLDKQTTFDPLLIKTQIDKRQELLRHTYEMVKYINYLHSICEFIAVSADGYANNPTEFSNSLAPFQSIIIQLTQLLEGGRGYQAIEQLNELYKKSENLIQRLRQAVLRRRINSIGYMTT